MKTKLTVQDLTKMALCVALLIVSGFIRIPLPMTPSPVTTQTLVVNLIALILLPKQAAMTVGCYILLGIAGIPVFGGNGGFGAIAGPNGGFILGFLAAAYLISLLNEKLKNKLMHKSARYLLLSICVGMPVIYLCGSVVMSLVMGVPIGAVLLMAVVPFLIGDVLKCIASVVLALALEKGFARTAIH